MAARRDARGGRPGRAAPRTGAGRGRATGVARLSGGSRSAGGRQGAGRTAGDRPGRDKPRDKGLGGEQVEGRQAVRELLIANKRRVREIWMAADIDSAPIIEDIEQLASVRRVTVQEVARKKLEERARSEAPQGIIAFADPIPEADFGDMLGGTDGKPPFLVAVDGVTDPGNLGALLRCCDGAGVSGVLLPRHRAVHVTPTVAKASAGAVEHVPMTLVSGLPTAIKQMRDRGIWVVGLDDSGRDTIFDIGRFAGEGICVVLGAEGAGLSRLVRERCDTVVSIPMLGQVSSLNVSAAAALAVYEVARARMTGRE
ncbi:MAG: 23S rRNA (guanosine(2251)-2'-O)-methyltransferase RlmB [Acidimicrobiales bacterium]